MTGGDRHEGNNLSSREIAFAYALQFQQACTDLQNPMVEGVEIVDQKDVNTVTEYVNSCVVEHLGASANWLGPNGEVPATATHFGPRVAAALQGRQSSWTGIINDILGITGHCPSHKDIAIAMGHRGFLDDVLILPQIKGMLLEMGVPLADLAETIANLERVNDIID